MQHCIFKKQRKPVMASHIKTCRSFLPYSDPRTIPISKLVVQNGTLCHTALKTKNDCSPCSRALDGINKRYSFKKKERERCNDDFYIL